MTFLRAALSTLSALTVAGAMSLVTSAPAAADIMPCTPLHLLIANGVAETAPDVPTDADGGFGSRVAGPAMGRANGDGRNLLSRSYVPYKASDTANQAVPAGQVAAISQIDQLTKACPDQKLFLVGHGSGGQIMAAIARDIGAGKGPVKADKVAGVAVFADPTRTTAQPVFAGGATSPSAVPGTKATADAELRVTSLRLNTATAADGSGPAPVTNTSMGALAGRTANFCSHGDLSCDIPKDAAMAKVVAGVSQQVSTDLNDPLKIVTSAATAIGSSVIYAGSGLVDNVKVGSNGKVSVNTSGTTVMDRLVTAANPNAKPQDTITTAVTALTKIAGMGLNAAVAIGKDLLTASSIAEIGAAMLLGPEAALAAVAAKVGGSAIKLISSGTGDGLINLAFKEISDLVTDNAGLVRMALDSSYWQGSRNTGYFTTPVGTAGQTAVDWTADWVVAAAEDLSATKVASEKPKPTKTGPVAAAPGDAVAVASQILNGQK
ncbi:cutinase family protein [Nocardia asteroides]|uniref:cutinase family protein n=1 Tax=Nocardia asteroides TaxID=1824 RepID=UPI0037C6B0B6